MHLYDIEAIGDDTRYHVVVLASDAQAAIEYSGTFTEVAPHRYTLINVRKLEYNGILISETDVW